FSPADRILLVQRPLVGMLYESQSAVADQVDRRLVTRQQQQRGVDQHLMPREDALLFATRQHRDEIIAWPDDTLVDQRRDVFDHSFHAVGQDRHAVVFAAADVEELLRPLWD